MSWKNRIVSYSVTSSGLTPETGPQKVVDAVDAFRIRFVRFPLFLIDVFCCSVGSVGSVALVCSWLLVREER